MPRAPERSQRFAARARLNQPESFQRVFRGAQFRSSDSCFVVLAIANGLKHARLGLAMTKKRTPTATGRNRLKRIAREAFRRDPIAAAGMDIVVMNQFAAGTKTNAELFHSLANHWKVISAQCNASCC